ncbi:MAG: OmcA/MtrC family decaheme c-type cytochrome [Candidatus Omnitrophica bacterium]|nr:OmcA/MtrC family decaheme c-type cytochrome [Candidatus Omnitrophota bacterium]HPP00316.1 OmcA/MtrC family decaheme c-type cytochrome [bacterium]
MDRRGWILPLMGFAIGLCGMTAWGADGLQVKILSTVINQDLKPEVTFTVQDGVGNPLALSEVTVRFMIARLDVYDAQKGSSAYWSYNVRTQTVPEGYPNAGARAEQATLDSNGILTQLEFGKYLYTFNTALPADYDRTKTHTVGGQIQRNVDDKVFYANPLYHFVPNGSDVVALRKVVTTEACNACHAGLALHGGGRREVGYCILCHSPQSTDPDTGNTVDMTVMIHKIHMGEDLPSVQAGKPYQIVGNRQSLHDYSKVVFPMDHRNCTSCHDGPQGSVYKTAPSIRACGSCHDDVNFQTGEGHGPGNFPQQDDSMCTACHTAEGPEFGISVAGAHTVPAKSQKLRGLIAEILEVTDALPGQAPKVTFSLKQKDGSAVDPVELTSFAITYAGPTKEYTSYTREDASKTSSKVGEGTYTYTFTKALPVDAQGTYAFVIEGRRTVVLEDKPEGMQDITVVEGLMNPVKYVAVTDTQPVPRRQVVSLEKCNACHDQLSLHGSQRNVIDNCVTCHNPKVSDIGRRPEGVGGGQSVSFAYMIHKIHAGEELEKDYTVYGFGNTPHNYNHVLFPGLLNKCDMCHVTSVPALPLSSDVLPINFTDKDGKNVRIPPTSAACNSCHDNDSALAHAELNTTSEGIESCAVCHREGRDASIAEAHAVKQFLNVIETMGPPPTAVEHWSMFLNQ